MYSSCAVFLYVLTIMGTVSFKAPLKMSSPQICSFGSELLSRNSEKASWCSFHVTDTDFTFHAFGHGVDVFVIHTTLKLQLLSILVSVNIGFHEKKT